MSFKTVIILIILLQHESLNKCVIFTLSQSGVVSQEMVALLAWMLWTSTLWMVQLRPNTSTVMMVKTKITNVTRFGLSIATSHASQDHWSKK